MSQFQSSQSTSTLAQLENASEFRFRHVGPRNEDVSKMLKALNHTSLEKFIAETIPQDIVMSGTLDLPEGMTEANMLNKARSFAERNRVFKSFIGMGYHGTFTPSVILRNVLENPGWYTAYTPYQAEISQGRLEALLNFQTMIIDLTGMEIANASLLDEGTAAAEAMNLAWNQSPQSQPRRILVSNECHPQTIEVVKRRAEAVAIQVEVVDIDRVEIEDGDFAVLIQYPSTTGCVTDHTSLVEKARNKNCMILVAADLLALAILKPPGEWGADVVIGTTQRFGVPMGFGGPHAAYIAAREKFKRALPGRLVGVSIDAYQRPALRLALQTREQHIRREKATSNICTAQVLPAILASMYGVYHGPWGIRRIARRTHRLAAVLADGLKRMNVPVVHKCFFDTIAVDLKNDDKVQKVIAQALNQKCNLRSAASGLVTISLDETSSRADIEMLWGIFADGLQLSTPLPKLDELESRITSPIPENLNRRSEFLTHPVFTSHQSETEMLRYMSRLQAKDLSLAQSMIPLGSCTMKLNATSEMIPITWPEFGGLHPFAPRDQVKGSLEMIVELERMLCEITGFAAVSLQPNAGSAGEYAGLLAIRDYHLSRDQGHRNICLIPASAHGTNPASAVLAGMKVVVVRCDENGSIDLDDLKEKATEFKDQLAALMVTFPSTHGVFEETIREICDCVHQFGGQVYMDGANFNALVGLCRPAEFGADVCHLNLHKTFCIPHGGGGPGVGPIGVQEHLKNFLPGHRQLNTGPSHLSATQEQKPTAVASAPWGSASILPISWAYVTMMGATGLLEATQVAILNANYIAHRLAPHYPILFAGKNGRVAHECIIDLRPIKSTTQVDVEDVAKRLMDYGFHAPTMSWPVAGTLMIEPTESESLNELDLFCDAMIAIREEIAEIESGHAPKENNVLKNAPHTVAEVTSDQWDRPYSREKAAFPRAWIRERKFWPVVARINNPYGDRTLVCSCQA